MLKNQLHVALTRADKNELAQVVLRQELENAAKREEHSARKPSRGYLMKTKIFAAGTALTCLMLCAGCTSARRTDASDRRHACPKVSLCPMPGSDPQTNGDLSADIRQLENALARCASQVKMIKHCQDENDAQTRQPAQGAD
ncbi:Rz1-like lysis system protein LysC [Escherichia coli]